LDMVGGLAKNASELLYVVSTFLFALAVVPQIQTITSL
jgi:hypothetical protein